MTIQKYSVGAYPDGSLYESEDDGGEWVRTSDHELEMGKLNAIAADEINKAREGMGKLRKEWDDATRTRGYCSALGLQCPELAKARSETHDQ